MLTPRKVKYRKQQKKRVSGKASRGFLVNFGDYGLKACESGLLTARQIEAARRAMTRHVARGGKIWIRVFPDKPISRHAQEAPMGGGKGSVDHYGARIWKGTIIFEIGSISRDLAFEALRLASFKLPFKTKIVGREDV